MAIATPPRFGFRRVAQIPLGEKMIGKFRSRSIGKVGLLQKKDLCPRRFSSSHSLLRLLVEHRSQALYDTTLIITMEYNLLSVQVKPVIALNKVRVTTDLEWKSSRRKKLQQNKHTQIYKKDHQGQRSAPGGPYLAACLIQTGPPKTESHLGEA